MLRRNRSGRARAGARLGLGTLIVSLLGLVGWLTWPAHSEFDVLRCAPDGAVARLSATLYGRAFWRSRLVAVEAERRLAEGWDHLQAEIDTRIKRTLSWNEDGLKSLYARHPELAPTPAELATSRAQEASEATETLSQRAQVREFVAARARSLAACEREIRARMER
jgi:hypothetical protein